MWIAQGHDKSAMHPLSKFILDDSNVLSQACFCVGCCPLRTPWQLYRDTVFLSLHIFRKVQRNVNTKKSQGLVRYCHVWSQTTLSTFQVNVTWKPTQSGMYSLIHDLSLFVLFFQLNGGNGVRTCSFLMYNNQQSLWQTLTVWGMLTLWNNTA